jgi:hypothetical protein
MHISQAKNADEGLTAEEGAETPTTCLSVDYPKGIAHEKPISSVEERFNLPLPAELLAVQDDGGGEGALQE